jgi:hypothetical protein
MSGRLFDVFIQHTRAVVPRQTARSMKDRVCAIMILPDPDPGFDKMWTRRTRRNSQPVAMERHGVVVAGLTLFLDAKKLIQVDAGDRDER